MSILRLTSKRQQHDNQTRSNPSDGPYSRESAPYSGAQEISGLEIMQLVRCQRLTNDSSFNRMQLSGCKFGVTDGRITCAERPRVKSLESVSKITVQN